MRSSHTSVRVPDRLVDHGQAAWFSTGHCFVCSSLFVPVAHLPSYTTISSGQTIGQTMLDDPSLIRLKEADNEVANEVQSSLAGSVRNWRADHRASQLHIPHQERQTRGPAGGGVDDGQCYICAGLYFCRPTALARAKSATQGEVSGGNGTGIRSD